MDSFIRSAESVSLTETDIKMLTKNNVKIMSYPELEGLSLSQVFDTSDYVCVLFETRHDYGHWVLLSKLSDSKGTFYEYFDPYAFGVDEVLEKVPEHTREALGEDDFHLTFLFKDQRVVVNHVRLQKYAEDVNTCGRHCISRYWHRDKTLKKYISFMIDSRNDPDYLVTISCVWCQIGKV